MGKHLDFYEKCVVNMKMPGDGLCICANDGDISADILTEYFEPTQGERNHLIDQGLSTWYWASGLNRRTNYSDIAYTFTPLRQTIVLFMAAINNEL